MPRSIASFGNRPYKHPTNLDVYSSLTFVHFPKNGWNQRRFSGSNLSNDGNQTVWLYPKFNVTQDIWFINASPWEGSTLQYYWLSWNKKQIMRSYKKTKFIIEEARMVRGRGDGEAGLLTFKLIVGDGHLIQLLSTHEFVQSLDWNGHLQTIQRQSSISQNSRHEMLKDDRSVFLIITEMKQRCFWRYGI